MTSVGLLRLPLAVNVISVTLVNHLGPKVTGQAKSHLINCGRATPEPSGHAQLSVRGVVLFSPLRNLYHLSTSSFFLSCGSLQNDQQQENINDTLKYLPCLNGNTHFPSVKHYTHACVISCVYLCLCECVCFSELLELFCSLLAPNFRLTFGQFFFLHSTYSPMTSHFERQAELLHPSQLIFAFSCDVSSSTTMRCGSRRGSSSSSNSSSVAIAVVLVAVVIVVAVVVAHVVRLSRSEMYERILKHFTSRKTSAPLL